MKTKFKLLGTVFTLGLLAFGARAAGILNENFDEYSDGLLPLGPSQTWTNHSGTGGIAVSGGQLYDGQIYSSDVSTLLPGGPYAPVGTDMFYASFTVNFQILPTGNGGYYFAHFKDYGTSNFRARLFALTNNAGTGKFRLGIASAAGSAAYTNTTDLIVGTTYTVVMRYVNPTNTFAPVSSTLWINPTSEASPSGTANDATTPIAISMYAFRQPGSTTAGIAASGATVAIDNLLVGTTFADVVSGSVNPPTIIVQPQDVTVFAGVNASFTNLAAGDPTLIYQWYSVTNNVTNAIAGATGLTVSLTGLATNQSGLYFAMVTNSAGTNFTRSAVLTVSPQPIPPTITNQPVNATAIVGDTVTLKVGAYGLPAPAYQWKSVTNNGVVLITNNMAGANVAGTNSDTLTFTGILASEAGTYFCTITNASSVGYMQTNSALAVITVNPPPAISIANFRAKVDGSFAPTNTAAIYTLTGIVTTWADMTGVANSEFYMQDASGGIAVFWSGANATTNLPPAGALVQVSGPMAAFNGLLEIEPVFTNSLHSVVILSTNNPLPKAQPLPFDPNVSGYPATAKNATMDKLEGMYLVASNVMLSLSTPNFVSGANDIITNNVRHVLSATNSVATINFTNQAGQQYILFINAQSGLPNQAKYTGPVTIYGVLGYFTSAGYEFTPSRFADIVSYVNQTNVVSPVVRQGDLLTNAYTENKLLNGETLTTRLSIGDPEGGSVTLSPSTGGLPASASWSGVTSGQTGTAVFKFTPTTSDAGSNYVVGIGVSTTTGGSFSNLFTVYVPDTNEQKIAISEFLVNPTTNSSAPNYNPLKRSSPPAGAATNDVFIEIASQALNDINLYAWGIYNGTTLVEDFSLNGPTLSHSNAIVVYGGPSDGSSVPNLPVYNEVATSHALTLSTGGGTFILRNLNGNIVDRVVYTASVVNTNGSATRFPNFNGPFVPQPFVSTNLNTPGLQYDGSAWNKTNKVPVGVNNVGIRTANGNVMFNFTANTGLASTLWSAGSLTGPYNVIYGQQFQTTSGAFTNSQAGPMQFYFISNQ